MIKLFYKLALVGAVFTSSLIGATSLFEHEVSSNSKRGTTAAPPVPNALTQGKKITLPPGVTLNTNNKIIGKDNTFYGVANSISQSEILDISSGGWTARVLYSLNGLITNDDNSIISYDASNNWLAFVNPAVSVSNASRVEIMDLDTQTIIKITDVNVGYQGVVGLQFASDNALWFSACNAQNPTENSIYEVTPLFLKNKFLQTFTTHTYLLPKVAGVGPKVTGIGIKVQVYDNRKFLWIWTQGGTAGQNLWREIIIDHKNLPPHLIQLKGSNPNVNLSMMYRTQDAPFAVADNGSVYINAVWFLQSSRNPQNGELVVPYLSDTFTKVTDRVDADGNGNVLVYERAFNDGKTLAFHYVDGSAGLTMYGFIDTDMQPWIIYGGSPDTPFGSNYGEFRITSRGNVLYYGFNGDGSAAVSTVTNVSTYSSPDNNPALTLWSKLDVSSLGITESSNNEIGIVLDNYNNAFLFNANGMYRIYYSSNTVPITWMNFTYSPNSRHVWYKPNTITSSGNFKATVKNAHVTKISVNDKTIPDLDQIRTLSFTNEHDNENDSYIVNINYTIDNVKYSATVNVGVLTREPEAKITATSSGKTVKSYVGAIDPINKYTDLTTLPTVSDFYFSQEEVNIKPSESISTQKVTNQVMTYTPVEQKNGKFVTEGPTQTVTDNINGVNLDGKSTSGDAGFKGFYKITVSNQVQPAHVMYVQVQNQTTSTIANFWSTGNGKKLSEQVATHPKLFNNESVADLHKLNAAGVNKFIDISNKANLGSDPIPRKSGIHSVGAIIGIIFGAIAILGGIIVILFYYPRIKVKIIARRNSKKRK